MSEESCGLLELECELPLELIRLVFFRFMGLSGCLRGVEGLVLVEEKWETALEDLQKITNPKYQLEVGEGMGKE